MQYIILGSAGGLGSYLFRSLKESEKMVFGIDIRKSDTTTIMLNVSEINKLGNAIEKIVSQASSPISVVMSAIQGDRIRYSKNISDYIGSGEDLLTVPFNSILTIASILQSYPREIAKGDNYSDCHHIINIGSTASSKITFSESPYYGAGKAASHYLIKYLSQQLLSFGIICNTISPALLARNSASNAFLRKHLDILNPDLDHTKYSDVFSLISSLSEGRLSGIRGHDFILDNGLDNYSPFHALQEAVKQIPDG